MLWFHMCDLGVSFTFHLRESSVIFLQNGVLILNWKENKEAGAICLEIRIPRKKNKEFLRKDPSKIYGSYFIMEKNKNIFWFVNNSKYFHREMGLYIVVKLNFFVYFLGELKVSKRHFEINWPLCIDLEGFCLFSACCVCVSPD